MRDDILLRAQQVLLNYGNAFKASDDQLSEKVGAYLADLIDVYAEMYGEVERLRAREQTARDHLDAAEQNVYANVGPSPVLVEIRRAVAALDGEQQ